MFFQGPPAARPAPMTDGRAPCEEADGCYFVDFGAIFAEELAKVLRRRQEGMMCEIVFWQDEYRYF